jgi:E3 ubiquitin-protein ligase RNF14
MTSELSERCVELQNDEIEVLEVSPCHPSTLFTDSLPRPQSIYPGQSTLSDDIGGKLISMSIPIALTGNTQVKLVPSLSRGSRNGESSTSGQPIAHPELVLSHLPPLTVRLLLPETYPVEAPARVVSLKAGLEGDERSSWLPRSALQAVQNKLGVMWAEEKEAMGEGAGVLWKWWDWIGTGEFLTELGMMDTELR